MNSRRTKNSTNRNRAVILRNLKFALAFSILRFKMLIESILRGIGLISEECLWGFSLERERTWVDSKGEGD
jgi:hypothetical protein